MQIFLQGPFKPIPNLNGFDATKTRRIVMCQAIRADLPDEAQSLTTSVYRYPSERLYCQIAHD